MKTNLLTCLFLLFYSLPILGQNEERAYSNLLNNGLNECYSSTIEQIVSIDTIVQYINTPTPFFAYKHKGEIVQLKTHEEEFYIYKIEDTVLVKSFTDHDSVFSFQVSDSTYKKVYFSNNGQQITIFKNEEQWGYRLNPDGDTVSVSYNNSDSSSHIQYKPTTQIPVCTRCNWNGYTFYNTFNGHKMIELDSVNCRLTLLRSYPNGNFDSIFYEEKKDTLKTTKYYDNRGQFYRLDVELEASNTDPFEFYSKTSCTYYPLQPSLFLRKELMKRSLETESMKMYNSSNQLIAEQNFVYADGCGTRDIHTVSTGDGEYEFIIALQKGMHPPSKTLSSDSLFSKAKYTHFFHPYHQKIQYFSNTIELNVQPLDTVCLAQEEKLSMHEYLEDLFRLVSRDIKIKKKTLQIAITIQPNQSIEIHCDHKKLKAILDQFFRQNPVVKIIPQYRTHQYIHFNSSSNPIPPVYQDYPITKIAIKFKW